mmetsp:Transcript_11278/g.23744  ORF Transcript_11278/g.23744 Transcript_11278/m.23744 type:complete len:634 (+) Transcript_11278:113-2014(+)|eukprot:CAMPEP_0171351678 /NCGR_PEP_ID=MMETSP0878-20121228/39727_1 /TAXON_ID=67004 /ORGANISM="Thalassiosira weissflogii, Strain CCMP1336" /LENGTH=633 /DNA_ID=CAMNT_0011857061 /DNA_START=90 /DNA_END=1991 /DNA_ORIENTATION=-
MSTAQQNQGTAETAVVPSNGAPYLLPASSASSALLPVANASIPARATLLSQSSFTAPVAAAPQSAAAGLWASAAPASAFIPTPIATSSPSHDDYSATTLINNAIEQNAYHDYSRISSSQLAHRISNVKRKKPTFPQKLHTILSDEEAFGDIIMWMPHGRAWKIVDDRRLEEEVLPNFFRHKSRASFLRQVNNWGFKRVLGGRDENSYYNEFFLRGLPHVCLLMEGCKPKNKKQDKPSDGGGRNQDASAKMSKMFDVAPDFYKISEVHPLPPSNGSGEPVPLNKLKASGAQALHNGITPLVSSVTGNYVPAHGGAADENQASTSVLAAPSANIATLYPAVENISVTNPSLNSGAPMPDDDAAKMGASSYSSSMNPFIGGIPNFGSLTGQQQPSQQQAQTPAFPPNPFLFASQQPVGGSQSQQGGTNGGLNFMSFPPYNGIPLDPAVISLMQSALGAGTPGSATSLPPWTAPGDSSIMNAPSQAPIQPAQQSTQLQANTPYGNTSSQPYFLGGIPIDPNMFNFMQNALGPALPLPAPAGAPIVSTPQEYHTHQVDLNAFQTNGTATETANNKAQNYTLPSMNQNQISMDPNMLSLMQNMQNALASQQQSNGFNTTTISDSNCSSQKGDPNNFVTL